MVTLALKVLNEDVMSLSGTVFHKFVAIIGTNEMWHLREQRVDGEENVYLFIGKNWVSVRQCKVAQAMYNLIQCAHTG